MLRLKPKTGDIFKDPLCPSNHCVSKTLYYQSLALAALESIFCIDIFPLISHFARFDSRHAESALLMIFQEKKIDDTKIEYFKTRK